MQYYNVSMMEVMKAVKTSNNDVGGRIWNEQHIYIEWGLIYKNIKDVEEMPSKL
jgi:Cu(I)/Ag(I) efflux system membrane protein CusA/SilA